MTSEQINYLSSLRRGYAAVYAEGDNYPKMIRFPLVKNSSELSREAVISRIRKNVDQLIGAYDINCNHHFGCTYCEEQCRWREPVLQRIRKAQQIQTKDSNRFEDICAWLSKGKYSISYLNGTVKALCRADEPKSFFERICIIGNVIERCELKDADKARLMSGFIRHGRRSGYG